MPRRHNVRPAFTNDVIAVRKRDRRERRLRAREQFQRTRAVWVVQKMRLSRAELEWRILVLTTPDTRSLTGRLMGDPQFLRSALYFHTLKEKTYA